MRLPWVTLTNFIGLGLLAAIALAVSTWGTVWLAIPVVLSMGTLVRYAVFETLGHTRRLWLEPALAAAAVGVHVSVNVWSGAGLAGWLAPLPFVVFTLVGLMPVTVRARAMMRAAEHAAAVGHDAPSFALANHEGRTVALSDFAGKPVLLLFVRGDWCPACHIMLRVYQRRRAELAAKGVVIVAIGPDPQGVNRDMVHTLGLDYALLSDPELDVARRYGVLLESEKEYVNGMPLPAAFLVDGAGVIRFASHPANGGELLHPEELFPIVAGLGEPGA